MIAHLTPLAAETGPSRKSHGGRPGPASCVPDL